MVFLHLMCGSTSDSYACSFSFLQPPNYSLARGSGLVAEGRLVCTLWCFHSVVSYSISLSIPMEEGRIRQERNYFNMTSKVPTLFFPSPSPLCVTNLCCFLCFQYFLFFQADFPETFRLYTDDTSPQRHSLTTHFS